MTFSAYLFQSLIYSFFIKFGILAIDKHTRCQISLSKFGNSMNDILLCKIFVLDFNRIHKVTF